MPDMNGRQFLAALKKCSKQFTWNSGPMGIRGRAEVGGVVLIFCPITAVCHVEMNQYFLPMEYCRAANQLGLSGRQREKTARAADQSYHHNARSRAALLRATGLSEKKAVGK